MPGRSGAGDCPCKGLIFQDRGSPLSPASAHRFSLLPLLGAHIVGGACTAIRFEICAPYRGEVHKSAPRGRGKPRPWNMCPLQGPLRVRIQKRAASSISHRPATQNNYQNLLSLKTFILQCSVSFYFYLFPAGGPAREMSFFLMFFEDITSAISCQRRGRRRCRAMRRAF